MNATMEVDQGAVEAVDGADGEPMPKRPRHAAFASSSSPSSLKQQLSQLASELSQAVRALVEADKKADEREQEEEEEEEQGVEPIDASKKPSTSYPSTTLTAPRAAPEVSAAASALEQLLRALSQARKERGESAVPGGIERALDEWREGVEVKKRVFFHFPRPHFLFLPPLFSARLLTIHPPPPPLSRSLPSPPLALHREGLLLPPPGPPRRLPGPSREAPEPPGPRRRAPPPGRGRRRRRVPAGEEAGVHLARALAGLAARATPAPGREQAPGAAGVADQGLGAAEALR